MDIDNVENYYTTVHVNISSDSNKGKRKYMEDFIKIEVDEEEKCTFIAVFDGHGGPDAAKYASRCLWPNIKAQKDFRSHSVGKIKKAIKEGFIATHLEMWRVVETWPKRGTGHHSTSGTTATVAIIKGQKLFLAHVGDSAAVLGSADVDNSNSEMVKSRVLTVDHKPDCPHERRRIRSLGGKVTVKKGIARVVWKRPHSSTASFRHRNIHYEEVPFLAVSRSLGDLWSYDAEKDEFLVSPEPDVTYHEISPGRDQTLVLGSDGLFGVMSGNEVIQLVSSYPDKLKEKKNNLPNLLIEEALKRWKERKMRADNISAVVVAFSEIEVQGPESPASTVSCSTSKTLSIASDTDEIDEHDESPPVPKSGSDLIESLKPSLVRTMAFCCKDIRTMSDARTKKPLPAEIAKALEGNIEIKKDEKNQVPQTSINNILNHEERKDQKTRESCHTSEKPSTSTTRLGSVCISVSEQHTMEDPTCTKDSKIHSFAASPRGMSGILSRGEIEEIEIDITINFDDKPFRKRRSSEKVLPIEISSKKSRSFKSKSMERSSDIVTTVSAESVRQLEIGGDFSLVDISPSSPHNIPTTPPHRQCVASDN